jgi:hypothetical protein
MSLPHLKDVSAHGPISDLGFTVRLFEFDDEVITELARQSGSSKGRVVRLLLAKQIEELSSGD